MFILVVIMIVVVVVVLLLLLVLFLLKPYLRLRGPQPVHLGIKGEVVFTPFQ